ARSEHPGHLTHDPLWIADERHRPVSRARQVEGVVREREGPGVRLDQRRSGRRRPTTRLAEHPARQVEADNPGPPGGKPTGALGAAAPHLEHVPPGYLA